MILDTYDSRALEVYNLICEHIAETANDVAPSDKITQDILNLILSENADIILRYHDGQLAGAAVVATDDLFISPPWGGILRFYVRKQFRGTTVGRLLLKECCEWFDRRGIKQAFMSNKAAIGEDKLLINLARKYNFHPTAMVLERINNDGP